MYKYNGIFYREATYKALLVKQLNDAKYQKNGAALTTSDIAIGTDGSLAGVKITLADGTYTLDGSSSSKTAAETYVNGTSYVTATKGYANGMCFYQIPVEHLGGLVGMVRNHWYQIKINSINHVGEPVYNEEVEIPNIPEETTEYYLAAEIHILSWHLVSQSVDL